jgi:uncharacterized protein YoxC
MEWDAGAFMRIAIGVFFLAFGAGMAYALFRLSSVFNKLARILSDAGTQVLPMLSRVETTLDEVNSELGKVDQITGSVAEMVKTVEHTATAVHNAVARPARKAAGLAAGVSEGIVSFLSGKSKEG